MRWCGGCHGKLGCEKMRKKIVLLSVASEIFDGGAFVSEWHLQCHF